jgi:hypothetical protein
VFDEERCWICGGPFPDTWIDVEAEYPGGPKCEPKEVAVHFECYMEIEP